MNWQCKNQNKIKNLSELLLLFSVHLRTVTAGKLQPSDDGWMSSVKHIDCPSLDSIGKDTKSPAQLALISFSLAVSGEQKDQTAAESAPVG